MVENLNTKWTFSCIKELLTLTLKFLGEIMILWLFLMCPYLLETYTKKFIVEII